MEKEQIIKEYISEILKTIDIKSKKINILTANHGSSKGGYIDVEVFWDELNHDWTTKEVAYRNYVIFKIKPIINKVLNDIKI
ncbi:hypothetical protein M0Q50_01965 [bacterium]|jgi:hypothetical protein|nr:hypothetical protein [bacterium]